VRPSIADAAVGAPEVGQREPVAVNDGGAGPDDVAESSAPDEVGWAKPLGIFGPVIDAWVTAAAHDVNSQCCIFSGVERVQCREEELTNDLSGGLARLACFAHFAAQDAAVPAWLAQVEQALERRAACIYRGQCDLSADGAIGDCVANIPFDQMPAKLNACPVRDSRKCLDRSGVPRSALACDGNSACQDDWDELNCPESRDGFRCSASQVVPWSAVCDGRDDCANRADEIVCTPTTP